MPKKTFTAGEVLAAADVNTFLMDQSVMTFADSGARGSAIGTATEGMLTYLNDTDTYQSWNGTAWVGVGGEAGSGNAIINGAFDIWQRGTSFTNPADASYSADRWMIARNGTGATRTISQQAFTPGAAPVAGYEGAFFYRNAVSVAGSGETYHSIQNKIEDVRSFAGQTVTYSLWAKAETARTGRIGFQQNFGSGGSSTVFITSQDIALTTSWQRFERTFVIPSISGKTIGTGSFLAAVIDCPLNAISTTDIWGVQVEAGSEATPFKRNANSLQGELAACQRYYYRAGGDALYQVLGTGPAQLTTRSNAVIPFPVKMRVIPTSIDFSTLALQLYTGTTPIVITSAVLDGAAQSSNLGIADLTVASGLTVGTHYRVLTGNSLSGFIGFSAEL